LFKITLYISALLFVFSESAFAQSEVTIVEKEVLASFNSLVQASKDLNSAVYFSHIDENKFVGLNSDGTNWNSIDELIPLITQGFAFIDEVIRLEFTNVKISVIDSNTAVLVNEYEQSIRLKDGNEVNAAGGGTQVWSKYSGSWKIVSISASNKP